MHYGRAAEGESPFSWHWLYPLSACQESTAVCSFCFFVFFYLLSINLPSSLWTQTSCGFALQSQAFLKGRCINREKWGMNWSDDKRLNYLGSCIQYLRWLWFTGLCVLWDLLSRKELLTFRVSVCWFSDVTRWYDKSNPAGWLNFALCNSP